MSGNPHLATTWARWGEAVGAARLGVVAVHGRGGAPAGMRDVTERLAVPGLRCVAPAAAGGTWYPQGFLAPLATNEPHLTWALEAVAAARAELAAEGLGPERVVLLGFSQGACLLAEHLVRGGRCAGAALLTGGYVGPPGPPREPVTPAEGGPGGALRGVPVLLATAAEDSWVPLGRVRETARLAEAMGAEVQLEVYDDPVHHVSDAAVAATRQLLARAAAVA